MVLSKGCSLVQWIFTGIVRWTFSGNFQWNYTFVRSGVKYFALSLAAGAQRKRAAQGGVRGREVGVDEHAAGFPPRESPAGGTLARFGCHYLSDATCRTRALLTRANNAVLQELETGRVSGANPYARRAMAPGRPGPPAGRESGRA